jgi:quinol monooxygenase YgiN
MPPRPDRYRGPGPGAPGADEPLPGPQASTGGSPAATPARPPYGRILIFTLLDDRVADFDRLAEQTAEEIRTGEPDTLVYVIHLVPNAPMQRIFYEIYRDLAAFESHESQPYMQRFVAERRSCVLATNVIELRLKYAKVAPLPNPQAPVPALPPGPPPRPQPSPIGPPAVPRGLPGASGPQGTQRPAPLPPVRPQRPDQRWPDQPRPDQQRPDQQRLDPQRPDQRQVPSAGRPYRG